MTNQKYFSSIGTITFSKELLNDHYQQTFDFMHLYREIVGRYIHGQRKLSYYFDLELNDLTQAQNECNGHFDFDITLDFYSESVEVPYSQHLSNIDSDLIQLIKTEIDDMDEYYRQVEDGINMISNFMELLNSNPDYKVIWNLAEQDIYSRPNINTGTFEWVTSNILDNEKSNLTLSARQSNVKQIPPLPIFQAQYGFTSKEAFLINPQTLVPSSQEKFYKFFYAVNDCADTNDIEFEKPLTYDNLKQFLIEHYQADVCFDPERITVLSDFCYDYQTLTR